MTTERAGPLSQRAAAPPSRPPRLPRGSRFHRLRHRDQRLKMRETRLPTSIRLPAALKLRLLAIARKRRQPLSLLIIHVLELWVEHVGKEKK